MVFVKGRRATLTAFDKKALDALQPTWAALGVVYAEAGLELTQGGREHVQGYFEFDEPKSLKQLQEIWPGAHWEVCQGNQFQNLMYIRKGEMSHEDWKKYAQHGPTYGKNYKECFVFGQLKRQGKRTDLDNVMLAVSQGDSLRDIALANPSQFIRYTKGISAYHSIMSKPRDSAIPKEVEVYFGPTGCGKTRKAHEENPDAYLWTPSQKTWFDGYDGHKTVIMDEFRGQIAFGFLLGILDRYPMKVEVKGNMVQFSPDKVIITSPVSPEYWYQNLENKDGLMDQLRRRITKTVDMTPYVMPSSPDTVMEQFL